MEALERSQLSRVRQPVSHATGLPNGFYTDPEVFEAEKRVLFAQSWACIGFGKDVPENGMAVPVDFLGQPLLMVRDREGTLRVFQNVCRHRGMIMVEQPVKLNNVLRCPYHSWCYGLDGSLRTTPHVGGPGQNLHECVNRDDLGLLEVSSAELFDMIWVNIDGKAGPFEDFAKDLTRRWSEFTGRRFYHGGADSSFALEVNCNWKLAVENYCESYHLPWIHPGLNSYSRLEDHYNIVEPMKFSGQGTVVYNPDLRDEGRSFVNFEGLSDKWDTGAEYVALYPNVLLGVHRDHYYTILLVPHAHNRTTERVELYYAAPEMCLEDYARLRRQHAKLWKDIFIEDIFVVEGMQRGRAATLFDGGKFSPVMDEATHCFHDWVARRFEPA